MSRITLRPQVTYTHTDEGIVILTRVDAGVGQMVASSRSSPLDGRRPSVRSAK